MDNAVISTSVKMTSVLLSSGLELDLYTDQALGYVQLSAIPEFSAPIPNPWPTFDRALELLNPVGREQWLYLSLIFYLEENRSKDELSIQPCDMEQLLSYMEGFWGDVELCSAILFTDDKDKLASGYVKVSDVLNNMESFEFCFLRDSILGVMRRGNLSHAQESFISYNEILHSMLLKQSYINKFLRRLHRGEIKVTPDKVIVGLSTETSEWILPSLWRGHVENTLEEMKRKIGVGEEAVELLNDAQCFLEDCLPHILDGSSTSLGAHLYERREELTPLKLLECYLMVEEYNEEWAMAAL